jgi:hypothetical protein
VADLYAARARAYAAGSAEALDAVYSAQSPLRAADAAEIEQLSASGAVVRGFAPEVVEVRGSAPAGARAELRLVDRWPAYTVVGRGGGEERVPGRGERLVSLVLVRTEGGWRIDSGRILT